MGGCVGETLVIDQPLLLVSCLSRNVRESFLRDELKVERGVVEVCVRLHSERWYRIDTTFGSGFLRMGRWCSTVVAWPRVTGVIDLSQIHLSPCVTYFR